MRKNTTTFDKVNNLLIFLSKQRNVSVNITKVIDELQSPYKNSIGTVLSKLEIIRWKSKSNYQVCEYIINSELVNKIIDDCKAYTNKVKKDKHTIVTKVIEQPVNVTINPFGFAAFDTIMVEKGKIMIGEYMLEGNFTITKILK